MTVKHITDSGCGIIEEQSEAEASAEPPIILAVDTSSPRAGLALARGERLISSLAEESRAPHSQTLFLHLTALLARAQLDLAQVDAFAVATGPGSFTGLRVGLAAVKGLAHTLGRPAIGVTSLDATALAADFAGRVVAMIDAGRGEVYCGLREVTAAGDVSKLGEDRVGPPRAALGHLLNYLNNGSVAFAGEGARHYRDEIVEAAAIAGTHLEAATSAKSQGVAWQLKDAQLDLAPHIALRASRLFNSGRWPGPQAYYIRPSDAELKCR
jgi:tRNA threonylcarbamoyladenosine biosynthesis protein TsaB